MQCAYKYLVCVCVGILIYNYTCVIKLCARYVVVL